MDVKEVGCDIVVWIQLVQVGVQWRAFENTVIDHRVPWKAETRCDYELLKEDCAPRNKLQFILVPTFATYLSQWLGWGQPCRPSYCVSRWLPCHVIGRTCRKEGWNKTQWAV